MNSVFRTNITYFMEGQINIVERRETLKSKMRSYSSYVILGKPFNPSLPLNILIYSIRMPTQNIPNCRMTPEWQIDGLLMSMVTTYGDYGLSGDRNVCTFGL